MHVDDRECVVAASSLDRLSCVTPATSRDLTDAEPRATVSVRVGVRKIIPDPTPPLNALELLDSFVEPGCDLGRWGQSISCETGVFDPYIAAAFAARGYTDCDDLSSACLYGQRSPQPDNDPPHLAALIWSEFETPVVSRGPDFGARDVGADEFNRLFRASPNGIIKRWCADCSDAHRQIFYK